MLYYTFPDTDVGRVLPYIPRGVTAGVVTQSVPPEDDGLSSPIDVQFPFGFQLRSTVYVRL